MTAKPAFSFKVRRDSQFPKTVRLLKSWPDRIDHIEGMQAYLGADFLKRYVQSKLPSSGATKAYRNSLEVARIRGTGKGEYSFAVQADVSHQGVRKLNVTQELLYVRPTGVAGPTRRAIAVLAQYNPWTVDTLPFKPDPKAATVERRKAPAQQVQAAARDRKRQESRWGAQLVRASIRPTWKNQTLQIDKNNRALPDIALDALKMEFGLGTRPQPHWRLGALALKRQGFAAISKDSRFFKDPMIQSAHTEWKKWPPRTKHSISIEQAKRFQGFQRKVVPSA